MTRTLNQLRSICPGCGLRRFIPHAWAPYCTKSCKRDAARAEMAASVAGKEGPSLMTTTGQTAAEAAVRRAHAAGKCLALRDGNALQPFYGDYAEHDPDAGPKREVTPEEAMGCYLGHRECARCRWLRAILGLPQHRTFDDAMTS